MSEPRRCSTDLSLDNILSRMLPGRTYPAHVMAAKFKVSAPEIRVYLDQLVARGDVVLSNAIPKVLGFKRPGEAPEPAPAKKQATVDLGTTIAAPRAAPPLSGELSGYGVGMTQHRALCMTLRAAR